MTEHFFILRLVRYGPLMPVRFFDCDHEPGEPDNPRDRWPSPIPAAEVAGEWYDPAPRGNDPLERGLTLDPVQELWERQWAAAAWKKSQPISPHEYRFRTDTIAWARKHAPSDPRCRPWRAVRARDIATPEFEGEPE